MPSLNNRPSSSPHQKNPKRQTKKKLFEIEDDNQNNQTNQTNEEQKLLGLDGKKKVLLKKKENVNFDLKNTFHFNQNDNNNNDNYNNNDNNYDENNKNDNFDDFILFDSYNDDSSFSINDEHSQHAPLLHLKVFFFLHFLF